MTAFSACKRAQGSGRTDTYSSGAITFASDESFSPIIEEERELFESTYHDAKLTPIYTSESEAITMLLQQKVWLAVTSRDFRKEEKESLESQNQFPQAIKIAYDGMALIQNRSNTDSCISVQDVRRILNGEVTRWDELYPGSKLGEITVVFDNPRSAAVHYVEDSILGGKAITSPIAIAVKNSPEVIAYVEKDKAAIGIIGSNWLNDQRDTTNLTFRKEVRPMAISKDHPATVASSWKPYQYYFLTGDYPFTRTIYILLNDTKRGLPTGFKNFIISQDRGQLVFLKAGFLPAYGRLTIREVHVNDN